MFPSTSGCSLPSLPRGRAGHTLFTTEGGVAVCGGGYYGTNEDYVDSCIVLNRETRRWEEGRLGSLPQNRRWHTAVTLKSIGTYLIGGFSRANPGTLTDYLAPGSQEWVSGPQNPIDMKWGPCSVVISGRSFLAIYDTDIREYQVDIENPRSDAGWQEETKWPHLQTSRVQSPGCARIGGMVIIAGGRSSPGSGGWSGTTVHRTTEILDIAARTIQYGEDLITARRYFHIITITTNNIESTFALGGRGYNGAIWTDHEIYDSIEEFDPDTLTWNTVPAKLANRIGEFAAVALPRSLVCQA